MEDNQPLLHFLLPEDKVIAVVRDLYKYLRKDKRYLQKLKNEQLKQLIRLHNQENNAYRNDTNYIPLQGNKSDLILKVEKLLYKETVTVQQIFSDFSKRPNISTEQPPNKMRKITHKSNSISNFAKDTWKQWWESEKVDFYHCQNPFYKEITQLLVVPIEFQGYQGKHPTYNKTGQFKLSAEQINQIRSKKYEIHIRLYHKHTRLDMEWLNSYMLQINGTYVSLTKKKTRTAPVKSPFVIPTPPIIEYKCLRPENTFSFKCPHSLSGYLVVQLVKEIDSELIIKNALSQEGGNSKKYDDDLAEVSLKVGIRCPLSFSKIEIPAKGIHCTHVQCFDFENYLLFCKQQSIWYCPICYKNLPPDEIRKDKYFKQILEYVGDEDSDEDIKVEINEDGSFRKMGLLNIPDGTEFVSHNSTNSTFSSSTDSLNDTTSKKNENNNSSLSFISLLDDSDDDIPKPKSINTQNVRTTVQPDSPNISRPISNLSRNIIISLSSDSEESF